MAAAQAAHFERRGLVSRMQRRAGRGGVSRGGVGRRLAEHQRDDPLVASGRDIDHADDDPVAKHRRPVAERRDLGHSMRNEDYRMPALAPVADDLEYALGQIRGQGGGNFVEQEYEGIGSERSRQVDQAQNRIRKVTNEGVEAKVLDPERLEPPPHRARSHVGQPHVVGDGQIGNQGRVLIDRNDARGSRLGGRAKRPHGVADRDRSPVRGKTPVRIFTSVLLPAPFAPISAWTSPGARSGSPSEARRPSRTSWRCRGLPGGLRRCS